MNILGIMFLVLFLWMFIFGNITINKVKTANILTRAVLSILFSVFITLIVGLPILGIIKLLGF